MNKIGKWVAVILTAVLFEFIYMQQEVWTVRLRKDIEKDLVYELKDLELLNWTESEEGPVSSIDPAIYIPTDPMRLYNLKCKTITEPEVNRWLFYYTADNGEVQVQNVEGKDGFFSLKLNKEIGPILRIDPITSPGTILKNCMVTINPTEFHISISRIIALVLIFFIGSKLMGIQKMPDYSKYISRKENESCQH